MHLAFGICPLCNQVSRLYDEVCLSCLEALHSHQYQRHSSYTCPRCFAPRLHEQAVCSHDTPPFPIVRIMPYIGVGKQLILSYKKTGIRRLSRTFASIMSPYVRRLEQEHGPTALVPIPCSRTRIRDFGWDHMLVAARRCGDQIPIPVLPLLERTNITAQKMLTKDQRICAAKQAFQVRLSSKTKEREHLRQVRTLIVCDDVMTTGASMHACMHALKQSYSLQIIGLCLAMD